MPQWLIPIFTIIAGVLGPLVTIQILFHRANRETLGAINGKVNHIDGCLDELKQAVARSTDHGDRITRLENWLYRRPGAEP